MAKQLSLETGETGKSILYPEFRLAYAMVKNAIMDLKNDDVITAFEALCFWLQDAPGWLKLLDLYSEQYFDRLIIGCKNGNKRKIN